MSFDPIGLLKDIFGGIAGIFNYMTGRSNLHNTPEMIENDKAKKQQDDDNEIDDIVENGDIDASRKRLGN